MGVQNRTSDPCKYIGQNIYFSQNVISQLQWLYPYESSLGARCTSGRTGCFHLGVNSLGCELCHLSVADNCWSLLLGTPAAKTNSQMEPLLRRGGTAQ